jgi:hypothetical protein
LLRRLELAAFFAAREPELVLLRALVERRLSSSPLFGFLAMPSVKDMSEVSVYPRHVATLVRVWGSASDRRITDVQDVGWPYWRHMHAEKTLSQQQAHTSTGRTKPCMDSP